MSKKTFIRHQQMKNETLAEALRAIGAGATCKREVQAAASLSWGAVSETINMLLDKKLVVSSGEPENQPSGAGRRSSHFKFSEKANLCMGMELHRRRIDSSLVSLGGKKICDDSSLFNSDLSPMNMKRRIEDAFHAQLKAAALREDDVASLTFSLTGAVDCMNKTWMQSTHVPSIRNFDFAAIESEFPSLLHFSVEHDIFAKARSVRSTLKWSEPDFVFIHIGDGFGAAIHSPGGFLYGSRGLAGEIGHIPAQAFAQGAKDRRCSCGQTNCLETFLSSSGVIAFFNEKFKEDIGSVDELYSTASPARMNDIYNFLRCYLLQACATLATLFDPSRIVLGGELIEPWLPRIQEELLHELQEKTWLRSPSSLDCYKMAECDSSFGAALNSIGPVIDILASKLGSDLA